MKILNDPSMPYRCNHTFQRGYSALISTLLLSAILSVLVFSASANAFLSRQNTTASEQYLQAIQLANSCASVALVNLAEDTAYSPKVGGDLISVLPHISCYIDSVTLAGNSATVHTHARVESSHAFVEVAATIDPSSTTVVTILNWNEIKNIGI